MDAERQIGTELSTLQDHAPAGFAIALHVKFTTPAFLFQTYPKAWIDIYSSRGFVLRDPTVIWGFDNLGVIDWTDLQENDSDGIMAMARDFGLVHGFTYALETGDSRSIASFAREDTPFDDDQKRRIVRSVDTIHRVTDGLDRLSDETRTALRRMSILFTHPGPDA